MKFIKELLDYAVLKDLLSGENLLELQDQGIYKADPKKIAEALEKKKRLNRLRLHAPLEIDEEDLLEAGCQGRVRPVPVAVDGTGEAVDGAAGLEALAFLEAGDGNFALHGA